jgi:hypothetical protein
VEERLEAIRRTLQLIRRIDPPKPGDAPLPRYAFTHLLYREALLRRVPPLRRRRLDARLHPTAASARPAGPAPRGPARIGRAGQGWGSA